VDLESLAASIDVDALAETVFSPEERLVFERTAPQRRQALLLSCWTWKEAILKATGCGLSISPTAAKVLLSPSLVASGKATIGCLGACWEVLSVVPQLGFVGAVAFAK
jgi:4'-phosphopantetheinyl transferase